MPAVDSQLAVAMSEVAKLELSFDDLMVRVAMKQVLRPARYFLYVSPDLNSRGRAHTKNTQHGARKYPLI